MRLQRLDLTRYGKFTGHSMDFGEPRPGAPDLHIVYGPNEAGKSTLFAAWLDLLYGIGAQTPFNFLHSYATMRIGGALALSGGVREFMRIKRPQNSLLDAHEQPVGDNAILGELGGIDRDAYRTMFSLDDDSLEEGGESILRAKGDLGQLLFSGSSGLADLARKIADLHAEADGYFRSHARSGQLHELQKELVQLKQQREQIDTQASKHAELAEIARRARIQHEEAAARRGKSQARRDEIGRLLNARPRLAKLRRQQEQLAPLAELPDAPAGWIEALPALREDEVRLEAQIGSNAQEIERSAAAAEAIAIDDAALGLLGKLDAAASLRARHVTAEKDLPDRRQKLRDLEQAIAFHLRQIEREGEEDPARLILPASMIERLRELIEQRSGVETAAAKAAEELTEARHRLEEAAGKLKDHVEVTSAGVDTEGREENFKLENLKLENLKQESLKQESLKLALDAFRASDHAFRRRQAERSCREGSAALDDCLARLVPWRGDVDELVAMLPPEPEILQHWKTAQQALAKRIDQQRGEMERLTGECARLCAQHEAVTSVTGLVTDHEAAAIRAERDQAWSEHRNRLDAVSADHFEELLRRDDGVVARRFAHMTDLAQLHETARALKIAQSQLLRIEEAHAGSLAEAQGVALEIAKAIGTLSALLPPDWTLTQLESWLLRRERALEARAGVRRAERDLQEARDDGAALAQRLGAAIRALNLPLPAEADEPALVAAAQHGLDKEAERRRLRQVLEERQRDLAARERAFERTEAGKRHWDAAWNEACGACWLGESGATPPVASVRGALAATAELASALKDRNELADRIDKMEKDQAAFRDIVISLADAAKVAHAETSAVMDLVRQIEERGRKAEADRGEKAKELKRLEAAREASRKLAELKRAHDRRKQEMTAHFGVTTLAEVAARLDEVARREELRREVADEEQELLATLRLAALREAEAALDAIDPSALEAELAEIAAQAETLEQEWRDSYAAYREAEKAIEAIGGDAKVAQIEEQRRTILVEIDEGARRYMRLRAGAFATEQALRLYRERHRSSMLARASEALRTVSRGAYTQLATQPDRDGEVLVAIAADKSSKLVTEMSKGTRFQLYLALRVAGYFEFAKTRSPVPFIADDIMETFDDFRAEEAFRLFAQMAEVGQVIYLTHHRHLCDIAREVCPTVTVHKLPERGFAT